jgi:hypothetical protein
MTTLEWTCERCEVTASWMPGVERPELPATWIEEDGRTYCLGCRRELAGEAALLRAQADASPKDRQQLHARARLEFEVARDPDRADGQIAQACHSSIPAVRKARARLGV